MSKGDKVLHWNTVTPELKIALKKLMEGRPFTEFRLVSGTALSLYWGHRMSVDIDLFTDATYGTIDFNLLEDHLKRSFPYVQGDFSANPGMGKSYLIGENQDSAIKLDVYYSTDPFYQSYNKREGVRMATIEEISAMKVDVIQRLGRKKDFWDLYWGLEYYTVEEMISFHKQRYEWTHDEDLTKMNFTSFTLADEDSNSVCLASKKSISISDRDIDHTKLCCFRKIYVSKWSMPE